MQRQVWAVCSCWPREQVWPRLRGCPPHLCSSDSSRYSAPLQQQGISGRILGGLLDSLLCPGHQGKTWRHLPHPRPGTVSQLLAVDLGCCPQQWLYEKYYLELAQATVPQLFMPKSKLTVMYFIKKMCCPDTQRKKCL